MKWSSALSDLPSLDDAISDCAAAIRGELGDRVPDLVLAFASSHHASNFELVPELVRRHMGEYLLIGCTGGGVIGAGHEVEDRPGFALTAASLPGVELAPFHIEDGDLPDQDAPPEKWEALVGALATDDPHFILLADTFSIAAEDLLRGLDYAFPRSAKIGGLAGGAHEPGGNALYLSEKVYSSGLVGVAVHGAVVVDTVVAQGCRPIGETMRVTSCSQNVLLELDGSTPLDVLKGILAVSSAHDKELIARNSLFLGVVMDPLNDAPQLGDFLIRNITGVDHKLGVLAVGEMLREGQSVQFHLRDADTSAQELDALLTEYAANNPIYEETGALLFQCLGRGSYLYGRPDHDTDMFREKVSAMPLTGFFCNGEIGPVGDTTYLHGYTSSFGIFRPKRRD